MEGAGLIQHWRQILAGVLAVYTLGLAGFGVATGESGGESGFEWLYLVPVITAAVMGLFLALRRADNPIGALIALTGAALMTLGVSDTMQPAAVGVWVKEE